MHKTAIPMVRMLHTCLVIHGRCKFIMFSARTNVKFIRADIETLADQTLSEKSINTVKHSVKSTFSISIQMQLASGNPQPSPYIYIYIHMNVNAMMMWADVWMVLQWYHNCSCIHAMMVILFVFPLCERDPALAWKSMVWTNAPPLPGICHCQEATVTKSVVSTCVKLIGPKLIWNLILYTKDAQFCRSTPFIHTHPFVQRKTIYIYIFCIHCCFVTFAFFSAWLVPRILHLMYLRFHIFSCLWNSLLQPPAAVPANQFRYQEASFPLILTFNRIDF